MSGLSEVDRRLNVEFKIRAVISNHGGERVVAGPEMDALVAELRLAFDELCFDGRFLPTMKELRSL